MSNPAKNCRWITGPGTYCEGKVKYKMVEDGGEPGAPKVRSYSTFCEEHEERAAEVQVELEDSGVDFDEPALLTLEEVLAPFRKPIPELTPEQIAEATKRLADERQDDAVVAAAIQAAPLSPERVEQCRRVRVHADWAAPFEPKWTKVFDMTDDELVPLFGRSLSGDTAIRKVHEWLGARAITRAETLGKKKDDEVAPEIELQRPACPTCHMEPSANGDCECSVNEPVKKSSVVPDGTPGPKALSNLFRF